MKIGLLWPDTWPYIRRGTERMVHDIAHFLADRGHEVHIIASKPGRAGVRREGGITTFLLRQIDHPLLMRARWLPRFDTHACQVLPLLLRERYDVVHCFWYTYAPALRVAAALCGTPYVYHVITIPPAWTRTADDWLLRQALDHAMAVRVFTGWCADYVREHYGVESTVLPPTVDVGHFRPCAEPDPAHPRILFTGDVVEERKGAHHLIEAFNRLHPRHPASALVLAGPVGFRLEEQVLRWIDPAVAAAVQVPGAGQLTSLPATYASAAVTVLPSVREAFGMVLTESLACGTPVVGTRHGGIPEIITDPAIGRLFDLGGEGGEAAAQTADNLATAIEETLELATDPATRARCRLHAAQWTWDALGDRFEILHGRGAQGVRAGAADTVPACR